MIQAQSLLIDIYFMFHLHLSANQIVNNCKFLLQFYTQILGLG